MSADTPPTTYSVAVDRSGLDRESLGPLFVRLSVKVSGTLDGRWCHCYERIATEADRFARFKLDPFRNVIFFTCRATDSAVEINNLMLRLDLLLELTNLQATLQAASEQSESA